MREKLEHLVKTGRERTRDRERIEYKITAEWLGKSPVEMFVDTTDSEH